MTDPERATRKALLQASQALTAGLLEAWELMRVFPPSRDDFIRFDAVQRTAARAFLKAFEQLQDVVAKTIRAVMLLEDEDLGGLTMRAVADRAETIGLIGDADLWSALVRLRNRLVHEYPLTADQQFLRLAEVWQAYSALLAVRSSIYEFLRGRDYREVEDD